MRPIERPQRACNRKAAAWLLAIAATAGSAAAQQSGPAPAADGIMPHIEAVLGDPEVARGIRAWGLSVADVRHDVDAMSPRDRARLAYVLTRRWRADETHSEADLQARFLVTMSLMRESTLFASVISSSPSGLLR